MLPSLFTLATQYRALQALDIEDIDEQTLLDTLSGLEGDLQTKATNVVAFQKNVQMYADMAQAAAEGMQRRAQVLQNRADNVKAYIKLAMETGGITKIESPEFTARIQNNPPSVVIDDESLLPAEFIVTPPPKPSPSKTLISAALKAGKDVPGAHLTQGTSLRIK
jgi:hypothetical protein